MDLGDVMITRLEKFFNSSLNPLYRKCKKCKKLQEITEFPINKTKKYGLGTWCKKCKAKYQKKYRTDPKRERKYNLKKKYNMTETDYNEMLRKQDGRCAICGTINPKGRGVFHIDHNHKTGEIRGLLCNNCNAGLGFFQDNFFILINAIMYIKNDGVLAERKCTRLRTRCWSEGDTKE